jgi:hypothetical protein
MSESEMEGVGVEKRRTLVRLAPFVVRGSSWLDRDGDASFSTLISFFFPFSSICLILHATIYVPVRRNARNMERTAAGEGGMVDFFCAFFR